MIARNTDGMLNEILKQLSPKNRWRDYLRYYPTITSTNDVLKQMAQQGAEHGTILIAGEQTGGRGRLGRSFQSPADVGIYMSVLLRPECKPEKLMHLTCAAACAACDAIEKSAGFRPGIKWTNDIVFQKRKLAGILTEMGFHPDGTVAYAVVGIGINCYQTQADFSPDIQAFAGSLAMVSQRSIDRAKVAAAMADAFQKMSDGLLENKESVMAQYRRDCITLGQDVSVIRADVTRYGKALDIDDEGALIVSFPDGCIETVNSGEVSVRGLYNYV